MDKSRSAGGGFNRRQRERMLKKEAEKAEYAKLEANIKNPAVLTDFNYLFRLQFSLDSI